MESESFGAWLRARLRELGDVGISQADLAGLLAVDKQTISSWKLERSAPRRAQKQRVESVVSGLLEEKAQRADAVAEQPAPYGESSILVRLSPEELQIVRIYRRLMGQSPESG